MCVCDENYTVFVIKTIRYTIVTWFSVSAKWKIDVCYVLLLLVAGRYITHKRKNMMIQSDFFENSQPLGRPIPLDEHAVSVSLPTWADVVGYEEGEKRVTDCMKIGYPRFKVHACIEKLIEITKSKHEIDIFHECIILPSLPVTATFVKFLKNGGCDSNIDVMPVGYRDIHAVSYPSAFKGHGKKFWQHAGEIVSSRLVEDALLSLELGLSSEDWAVTAQHNSAGLRLSASDAHMVELKESEKLRNGSFSLSQSSEESLLEIVLDTVKARISSIIHESPQQITICVSGMAAIFGALKCVQELDRQNNNTPGKIVVFGFPYLDTLKVLTAQCIDTLLSLACSALFTVAHLLCHSDDIVLGLSVPPSKRIFE